MFVFSSLDCLDCIVGVQISAQTLGTTNMHMVLMRHACGADGGCVCC